jgi:hypothetical protein
MRGITQLLLLTLFVFISQTFGQNDYEKEYVEITPEARYEAGMLYQFFFGKHWRDAWTTPIQVEVLDLEQFAGGLTPFKRGGERKGGSKIRRT